MGCVGQFFLGCLILLICAGMVATTTDGVAAELLPLYGGALLLMGTVAVYFQQQNAQRVDQVLEDATGVDLGFRKFAAIVVGGLVLLAFLVIGAMATMGGG